MYLLLFHLNALHHLAALGRTVASSFRFHVEPEQFFRILGLECPVALVLDNILRIM